MGQVSNLLMEIRNEWAVQALVLFSFTLQVILLSLAWIRRHSVSVAARLVLWMAYQLADATALFTLGHMAISSRTPEEQPLVAFWAPFLLLHLGGQDNITAYSFEDNRLWLRHLQTLVMQVLGASYVLYKYMPEKDDPVMAAAVLIFAVGILKYGERIWALQCARFDSIAKSLDEQDASIREIQGNKIVEDVLRQAPAGSGVGVEAVLMASHGLLDVCQGLFIGLRGAWRHNATSVLGYFKYHKCLDRLMEMELSLMYDTLYTKAAVIHTWYGCCIRVVALVATVAALFLFHRSDMDGHSRKNIAVSQILLAGGLLLEVISMVRAVGSTWTLLFLHRTGRRWLHGELLSVRGVFRVATHRRWSSSVGQYNLLMACAHGSASAAVLALTGDREPPNKATAWLLALAKAMDHYWARLFYTKYSVLTDSTKQQILEKLLGMREKGEVIGSLRGLRTLRKLKLEGRIGWTIGDIGFEDSIMAWHLATAICLEGSGYCSSNSDQSRSELVNAISALSNYMMFLLAFGRYMLPGPVRRRSYEQVRDKLQEFMAGGVSSSSPRERLDWALREGLHARLHSSGPPEQFDVGVRLAGVLYHRFDKLDVIFGVWVEMLCYVANNCSRESHARQLSSGGELVTVVWLMARHVELST
ncbi:uncharacterized protein LOC102704885 [Oryza brachyantha]|uniref:uncharacterized protein LOC102704885 n=1 Tax=Oryza brachyantha TaxID=4533 RepID=UPI001ADD129A|nr:uncharacterized protein LOC102704885 [Oryza brachyantha]